MTNFREILRLHNLGINNTRIASSLDCSRQTVVTALANAKAIGLNWDNAAEMSDRELYKTLTHGDKSKPDFKMPDYEYIHKEMAKSGVTLSLLWVEYCEQCGLTGEIPYKSTQFNKYYRDFVQKTKATMHINRKPGEIMEVDWAGETAGITDTDTGGVIDAYIFAAALPYSGYGYVEAFLSMNKECWVSAHVNAYDFFGGVSRIVVPDNLKTGVDKNTRQETIINKSYQEMAEHYGTAVIPARVRSPKDKSTVEGTIGIITTWILAAVRNRQFLSLTELNEAIREKLRDFNNKPFQKKDGSRSILFETEKAFLLPLPAKPFELSSWKTATVQFNYHIATDGQNYSVPYEYIRQKVDVRLTRKMVEVFFDGNRICSHVRVYGSNGQYSTNEQHMPPDHQKYAQWSGERFRAWAVKIGEKTAFVTELFLTRQKVEQQGYKSCMTLLKLADKYGTDRLEAACRKAVSYTPSPSLKAVQAILKSGQDIIAAEDKEPENRNHVASPYAFTRGAEYYKGGN